MCAIGWRRAVPPNLAQMHLRRGGGAGWLFMQILLHYMAISPRGLSANAITAKFAVVAFAGPEHTAKNRSDSCRRSFLVINIAQKFTLSKIINGGCGVLRTSKESRP